MLSLKPALLCEGICKIVCCKPLPGRSAFRLYPRRLVMLLLGRDADLFRRCWIFISHPIVPRSMLARGLELPNGCDLDLLSAAVRTMGT